MLVHGEDAYVHPGWYPSKAEHGRVVPTWNYTTAHVYGELVIHDDSAWVDENVRLLTSRQERARAEPWSVDDAPAPFLEGQLRAIVGVEIRISRVEAKFKMSQNQKSANIDGVIAGLTGDGRGEVAETVQRLRPDRTARRTRRYDDARTVAVAQLVEPRVVVRWSRVRVPSATLVRRSFWGIRPSGRTATF